MFATFCRAFVDARALKDFGKHLPDLILDDVFRVFGVELRMSAHKFVSPIRVLGNALIGVEIAAEVNVL